MVFTEKLGTLDKKYKIYHFYVIVSRLWLAITKISWFDINSFINAFVYI